MTALREAAQQALEALTEHGAAYLHHESIHQAAITALRAALAQQAEPVQEQAEPVPGAWVASPDGRVIYDDVSADDGLLRVSGDFENDEQRSRYAQRIVDKLNAALEQQAEPVQEPITRLFGTLPVHDTQQAEPVEPVEPVAKCIDDICSEHFGRVEAFDYLPRDTLLYTAPPQRKPLTQEESDNIYREFTLYQDRLTPSVLQRIVRAVERAHGIKE